MLLFLRNLKNYEASSVAFTDTITGKSVIITIQQPTEPNKVLLTCSDGSKLVLDIESPLSEKIDLRFTDISHLLDRAKGAARLSVIEDSNYNSFRIAVDAIREINILRLDAKVKHKAS